ncbi:MAG TPA: hypothetical protein PKC69_08975 [Chitinophagaceae bacterium]|nr:hypothetical protein [Chitinophagaceae bacterium]
MCRFSKAGVLLFFIILFIINGNALSQQRQQEKLSFQGMLSVGMAAGESKTELTTQLYGGITKGRISIGAGAGYDGYFSHSFPVFAGAQYLIGRQRKLFAYGQAGYHFPEDRMDSTMWLKAEYKGGFYMNTGMGYRLQLGSLHRLAFSAGFSIKYTSVSNTYFSPWCPSCDETVQRQYYRLGRIVSAITWQIGK